MIFSSIRERRSLENPQTNLADPANWLFEAFGAMPTEAGKTVTPKNVRQITAFFSAVATISDTIGELPIELVRKSRGRSSVISDNRVWNRLRHTPNPMMTDIVFKSTMQGNTLTRGNSCAWIKRNRAREAAQLWPLDPDCTSASVRDGRLLYRTRIDGAEKELSARDVLHIPSLSTNGVWGMSIIAEQREALGHAMAVSEFGSRFFRNGAKPSGLLSFPGKLRDPIKTREQIEAATGGENQHGLLVLGGDAKYTQFSIPPEDAQFLQSKEFSVDEIGRMFRLPLHFLNKMGQATFNNLEMMGTHFVQFTLMPWIKRWEQELTRKLLTPQEIEAGYHFKVNVSALARGDMRTRYDSYGKAIKDGWMTRNEVRELEDRNPIDGLDDPLVPLNMSALGDEPDDEPGDAPSDEPSDDESIDAARALIAQRQAAQRLVRNECNAIRRMLGGNIEQPWDNRQNGAALEYYEGMVERLMEWLAIPQAAARAYVVEHGEQLAKSKRVSDTLQQWESEAVDRLLNSTRGNA